MVFIIWDVVACGWDIVDEEREVVGMLGIGLIAQRIREKERKMETVVTDAMR